ncbi:response regulator receiver protein [Ferrimonas balearica DSM 9799]|uniref:Response regulator receiver protein n=1 Tax=Ferrimonas balearica (strain DSM 9799 / CCM 4581 / KCTC 23876 / PAT) TaxID=550540 RepID=E1SP82_FERBD|nr:response regulator [Ferrimonas balearica]MBY6019963.1 response regulator [Halomonas denitrificans]ADN75707.1 response regulator receiver protein [Ferrimonas balearica DSM 9799]MBW3138606.1 response regulator [Ferrimonas balearica]MBW3163805.1 response regulator [Ferrimonas balearica]MBY5979375.1 response regulator [Ferrimonas balearica]
MSAQRVLIIEDDPLLGPVLARRLNQHGYDTRWVNNKTDALLDARQWRPSHLLLDMNLGEDNGLALIAPLRATLPQAQLVLLTGYASVSTAVDAMRLGANHYLAKPVDTATLLSALTDAPVALSECADDTPINPKRLEWEHLQQALRQHDGNVSATARALGMHRRTLQRKLQKKPLADDALA